MIDTGSNAPEPAEQMVAIKINTRSIGVANRNSLNMDTLSFLFFFDFTSFLDGGDFAGVSVNSMLDVADI